MKYLSISQLNMLSFCGEQYRRRYVLGEKIPPGIALVVGSAVDDSISANLRQKMITSELLPIEQIGDIARDTVIHQFKQQEVSLKEEEKKVGIKTMKGLAIDKAVRLASLHAHQIAPNIVPIHIQRRIEVELFGYDTTLLGYIDIQEDDSIRDTKTTEKTPPKNTADLSDQLTFYALINFLLDAKIPRILSLDYLVDLRTPKVCVLETTRTVGDFSPMLARIENALTVIEKGAFVPTRQDNPLCNAKWCGYAPTCKYYRRGGKGGDGEYDS